MGEGGFAAVGRKGRGKKGGGKVFILVAVMAESTWESLNASGIQGKGEWHIAKLFPDCLGCLWDEESTRGNGRKNTRLFVPIRMKGHRLRRDWASGGNSQQGEGGGRGLGPSLIVKRKSEKLRINCLIADYPQDKTAEEYSNERGGGGGKEKGKKSAFSPSYREEKRETARKFFG